MRCLGETWRAGGSFVRPVYGANPTFRAALHFCSALHVPRLHYYLGDLIEGNSIPSLPWQTLIVALFMRHTALDALGNDVGADVLPLSDSQAELLSSVNFRDVASHVECIKKGMLYRSSQVVSTTELASLKIQVCSTVNTDIQQHWLEVGKELLLWWGSPAWQQLPKRFPRKS
jgi:hypothetical protein